MSALTYRYFGSLPKNGFNLAGIILTAQRIVKEFNEEVIEVLVHQVSLYPRKYNNVSDEDRGGAYKKTFLSTKTGKIVVLSPLHYTL